MSALAILFHTSYRWDDLQVVVFSIADCHWRYEGGHIMLELLFTPVNTFTLAKCYQRPPNVMGGICFEVTLYPTFYIMLINFLLYPRSP